MVITDLHNVSASYSGKTVFTDVSIQIRSGEKIALVGRNGIGKTTLFRLILGNMEPDDGEISRTRGVRSGYLPQEVELDRSWTLYDEVLDAFAELIAIGERIEEIELQISDGEPDEETLHEYGVLQERFESGGGFTYKSTIDAVLQGLGFELEEYHKPLRLFSGGEKARAYLAKLLLAKPDLLLLDEPTNHLDIPSTQWLESYLTDLDAAVMIVSHDRLFLSRTTTRTVELRPDGLDDYPGNFDFYMEERASRHELQSKAFERQRDEIARIEDFIRKNIAGQKTKQAQSRRKMLSKMKRLDKPASDGRAATLNIKSAGRSHLKLLTARNLSKEFSGREIFSDVSFEIERGEKVGLIGPNGSGKSTLVKIITGELEPDSGEVKVGGNVIPAYFDQELSILNPNDTVIDSVWEEKPTALAAELRSYLGRYLFEGEDVFKKVSALSGGEKSRLALAKIFLLPANLLILDEPTNHLDIPSCEQLEHALAEYDGAALVISHDRYFLDRTVSRIYAFEGSSLRLFLGNYSYYAEKKAEEMEALKAVSEEKLREKDERKSEWEQLKEKRRIRKQFEKLESRIYQTEDKISEIESLLGNEEVQRDWERLASLQKDKARLESELETLYREFDEFEHE